MTDAQEYIYVIGRTEGPVKIGVSRRPNERLNDLQGGCPFKLTVLHLFAEQNRNHALAHEQWFKDHHVDRRLVGEWFNMTADDARWAINFIFDTDAEIDRVNQ